MTACSAAKLAKPVPGTDITSVQTARSRPEIEAVLGAPLREWNSAAGVRYCLYEFDGGYMGDTSAARTALLLSIATLGFLEIGEFFGDSWTEKHIRETRFTRRLIVSYDQNGMALGVFGEFAVLPDDGRPINRDVGKP